MQTFLPYPDFRESARVLDNKRLGKQRVECLQILQTLAKGPYQKRICDALGYDDGFAPCSDKEFVSLPKYYKRRTPWYNHPACRMWRGKEHALALYGCHICFEWRKRGFQDNVIQKICGMMQWTNNLEIALRTLSFDPQYPKYDYPLWLGNKEFHASHRSNLLRKDFAWYNQFGWTEPTTLEYVWPV
jgi:hypothetical protein